MFENILWQWIIPVFTVFLFSFYSVYKLWLENKKYISISLLLVISVSVLFIYNGFQYGYRLTPLALFITLEFLIL